MTRPTTPPAATVHIPGLLTRTEGNSREHYWTANRRAKQQRGTTSLACARWLRYRGLARVIVITRLSPRRLDPQNLMSAVKHVIDGVADVVSPIRHVDRTGTERGDDSERAGIEWVCAQERGPTGVRVEVWCD